MAVKFYVIARTKTDPVDFWKSYVESFDGAWVENPCDALRFPNRKACAAYAKTVAGFERYGLKPAEIGYTINLNDPEEETK